MAEHGEQTHPGMDVVPAHFNDKGQWCSQEGRVAPRAHCPLGCDHADHYSNDGHPECEDDLLGV